MLRLVLDDAFLFESQNTYSFHREGMRSWTFQRRL